MTTSRMTRGWARSAVAAAVLLLVGLPAIGSVAAQEMGKAFAGFDSASAAPIQIEADRLEVRDAEKIAVYSGRVKVRQGGTVLETSQLTISYAGKGTAGASSVAGASVSRIEAGPKVVVRSKEQTASGDHAVLDMANNLVTMTGDVVVTQGDNVVRGERLVVDLATKRGRIEGGSGGGRVQTLITPTGGKAGP